MSPTDSGYISSTVRVTVFGTILRTSPQLVMEGLELWQKNSEFFVQLWSVLVGKKSQK